ncbi:UNVERIFIED_CONTAM: hypothetical protein Slati_1764300 [Sesamum latifolium]|uniref:Uncharacterized protein n=1 Tax=Sesamum latifolium TaxID=2727402 RepID=A0AAW2WXP0_9LAMI
MEVDGFECVERVGHHGVMRAVVEAGEGDDDGDGDGGGGGGGVAGRRNLGNPLKTDVTRRI